MVLVWGGSGGLGTMAIQIAKAMGGIPVAVTSSDEKGEYCEAARRDGLHQPQELRPLGPAAALDRRRSVRQMGAGSARVRQGALGSPGRAAQPAHRLRAPGRRHDPDIDLPLRQRRHGRDLRRHHRLRRRRRPALSLDAPEAPPGLPLRERRAGAGINQLVWDKKVDPQLANVYTFDEVGLCHQLMYEGKAPEGNMAILVNATKPGMTDTN